MGGSSPQAGEFLLKERVVVRSFFLAFQPLHVARNPRVVALGHKARERFRGNVVHKSLLGPIPKYAPLPLLGLLMAMLTLCQIPKLSACFSVSETACLASSKECPLHWTRAFAWLKRTSSAISETV